MSNFLWLNELLTWFSLKVRLKVVLNVNNGPKDWLM